MPVIKASDLPSWLPSEIHPLAELERMQVRAQDDELGELRIKRRNARVWLAGTRATVQQRFGREWRVMYTYDATEVEPC